MKLKVQYRFFSFCRLLVHSIMMSIEQRRRFSFPLTSSPTPHRSTISATFDFACWPIKTATNHRHAVELQRERNEKPTVPTRDCQRRLKSSRDFMSTRMPKCSAMSMTQCSEKRWEKWKFNNTQVSDDLTHVTQHLLSESWRCHLRFAAKLCHCCLHNRSVFDVGCGAGSALHPGEATWQVIDKLEQFDLFRTIYEYSILAHELGN